MREKEKLFLQLFIELQSSLLLLSETQMVTFFWIADRVLTTSVKDTARRARFYYPINDNLSRKQSLNWRMIVCRSIGTAVLLDHFCLSRLDPIENI